MSVCLRLAFFAIVISLSIIPFIPSHQAANPDVAIYWGQNLNNEPSLDEICSSGYYNYVMISYLINYSQGYTPSLNLASHCDPATPGSCTYLGEQIKACQNKRIKVFLSLGIAAAGPPGSDPVIPSILYARLLANYIWNHYLGGKSRDRPFGNAELDGVEFESQTPGPGLKWEELVGALFRLSQRERKKIYIAASPQCPQNDYYLDAAIKTGRVDYAWVRFFYHNPSCVYQNGNMGGLLTSWNYWSSLMGYNKKLLMGLPSSNSSDGYIPPDVLITKVLPVIKKSRNYGGIMVWTNFGPDPYTPVIKNKSYIKLYSVE